MSLHRRLGAQNGGTGQGIGPLRRSVRRGLHVARAWELDTTSLQDRGLCSDPNEHPGYRKEPDECEGGGDYATGVEETLLEAEWGSRAMKPLNFHSIAVVS